MKYYFSLLIPTLDWLKNYNQKSLKEDLISGFIAAIVILPQAAALATLAGLPPYYGVYASIFPVMAAALFGSSWHSIAGPNTTVSLMVMAAVIPFANVGTKDFIGFSLFLAFLVGLIQWLLAFLKFGTLLDFISSSVIKGVSNAVGFLIVTSALAGLFGVASNPGEPFIVKIYNAFFDILQPNKFAFLIGGSTIVIGFIFKKIIRRYYLVISMLAGIILERLITFTFGELTTDIDYIGKIGLLGSTPLSIPKWNIEAFIIWKGLITSAISIAFVGILQSVVIAKSLAEKTGQHLNINKEIFGQGAANLIAAFTSGIAGSSSFNRSNAHFETGTHTPLAAFSSGLFLFILVVIAGPASAYLSVPTISGVLVLVGSGLIVPREFKWKKSHFEESFIFYSVLLVSLFSGITDGVILGVLFSMFFYIKKLSNPILSDWHEDENGNLRVSIRGCLFFGSIKSLQSLFSQVALKDHRHKTLTLDLLETVDLDQSAIRTLDLESERRKIKGGNLNIILHQNNLENYDFKNLNIMTSKKSSK